MKKRRDGLRVFGDEGVGGRGDPARDAQTAGDAPGEDRLAGADLPAQQHDQAGTKARRQPPADALGFGGSVAGQQQIGVVGRYIFQSGSLPIFWMVTIRRVASERDPTAILSHRWSLRPPIAYRIAHIAPTSFFGDYGCHVRIVEEIRALRRRGHESVAFAYPTGEDPADVVTRRNPLQQRRSEVRVGSHWGKLPLDLALLGTVLGHGLRTRFDVVHAHLHEGALIGRFLAWQQRIPLVFDFQGSLAAEMRDHHFLTEGSWLERAIAQTERVINRLPDRIITSSSHARELLTGEFGLAAERVVEVSDCVNVDVFRPRAELPGFDLEALRSEHKIPPNRLVIGYLGLLAGYQGIPELLQAARQVVDEFDGCHFLVMGFPGEDLYREQARALGLENHVSFPGRVPYDRAPELLALADIAVSPKRSKTEGNGKLLNYMAAGLPTVAFDSPVAREFLGTEGSLVSARADDLAEALLQLLRDPDERTRYGAALRQRATERFGWDAGAQRIESVYAELLE